MLFHRVLAVLTILSADLAMGQASVGLRCQRKGKIPLTLDSVAAHRLAGSYELTLVVTSFNEPEWGPMRRRLLLRPPDSLEAATARLRSIGHSPRHSLLLLGSVEHDYEGRTYSDVVELDSGVVYIGCRDCNDGNPWHLRITAADASGLYGFWNDYQTGIDRVVDRRGRRLPDPAGYFCALRVVPQ